MPRGSDSGASKNSFRPKGLLFNILFKIAMPLALLGFAIYYFYGLNNVNIQSSYGKYGMGCGFDDEKYKSTLIYQPLASSSNKNIIPASFSLLKYAPTRKNQGQQGSCVGWASAYAARTIQEAFISGENPDILAFSPSFLYNQIALPNCQGSYTKDALEKMKNIGLVQYNKFKYDEESCNDKPDQFLIEEAKNFRIRGYNRLSKRGRNFDVDIEGVKQHIAHGAPVIIAMKVPKSFYELTKDLWEPRENEYKRLDKLGGHAMCAIGYDDNKFGGSVQIMNSWGRNWGNDGVFWMKYTDFIVFVREAYGLFPVHKKTAVDFEVSYGILHAESDSEISLYESKENLLRTRNPIKKNDPFKIEVNNNSECYIYIFGQKSDGSSHIVFPYIEKGEKKSKYSAFCGILGARHFDKILLSENENLSSLDFIAVVASKEDINYVELNNRINRTPGNDYNTRLKRSLSAMKITTPKVSFRASSVGFQGKCSSIHKTQSVVFAIDKK